MMFAWYRCADFYREGKLPFQVERSRRLDMEREERRHKYELQKLQLQQQQSQLTIKLEQNGCKATLYGNKDAVKEVLTYVHYTIQPKISHHGQNKMIGH